MHTNIPRWPNFSSLFQFTSAFTYWLLMPHKPLEYITKMYHIKMRRLETKSRKGVEKELSKDSRLFACTSSYAIKEGKKFRAKTSLEELFFFLSGSKWACIKLLLPTYYLFT